MLYENGKLKDYSDLYFLKFEQIIDLEKIYDSEEAGLKFEGNLQVKIEDAIFALGYGNISRKSSKLISDRIVRIEDLIINDFKFETDKEKNTFKKFKSSFKKRFDLYRSCEYYRFPFVDGYISLKEFLFLKFYSPKPVQKLFNDFDHLLNVADNIDYIDELKNNADLSKKHKDFEVAIMKISDRKVIGIRKQGAENIIKGIQDSKNIQFEKVLFALGIRYVGETVAKKLAKYYKNIDNLMKASFDELIRVDEIGDIIAQSIVEFFNLSSNRIIIQKLKEQGLHFEIIQKDNETERLKGLSFVVSGKFSVDRNMLKKAIEDNGGKNSTSLSKNTSYLVAGENMGPSKKIKAERLGTKIISEDYFFNELL